MATLSPFTTMAANKKFTARKKQKGMATLEVLPILVVFLVLIAYGLGFFGVVHSGILNSIASRAYAFETFRNRTNLDMFRDTGEADKISTYFMGKIGNRVHGIESEKDVDKADDNIHATTRSLSFGRGPSSQDGANQDQGSNSVILHNETVTDLQKRNRTVSVSPAWIMVGYGICLDAKCGD